MLLARKCLVPFAVWVVLGTACQHVERAQAPRVTPPVTVARDLGPAPRSFYQLDERRRVTYTIVERAQTVRATPQPAPLLALRPRSASLPVPAPNLVIPSGEPSPISGRRCPAGPIKQEIDAVFGVDRDWAESVAWRESNCTAGARNSSGSSGVFQLMVPLHDDLLTAVCPSIAPSQSWAIADCNIRAAYVLYQADSTRPWAL